MDVIQNDAQLPKTSYRIVGHVPRVLRLGVGLALATSLVVGCSSGASTAKTSPASGASKGCQAVTNGAATIVTKTFDFEPSCLTLVGNEIKITYENKESGVRHNFHLKGAQSSNGVSATNLTAGVNTQTITYVGLKPGTYTYVCDIHPGMKGRLAVKGS